MSSKKGVIYIIWQIVLLLCVCMSSGLGVCVLFFLLGVWMIHLLKLLCLFVFVVMFTSLFMTLLLLGECCFVSFVFVFTSLFLTNTFSLLWANVVLCFVLSLVCFVFVVFTSLFLTKTFSLLFGQSSSSSGFVNVSRAPARHRPSFLNQICWRILSIS